MFQSFEYPLESAIKATLQDNKIMTLYLMLLDIYQDQKVECRQEPSRHNPPDVTAHPSAPSLLTFNQHQSLCLTGGGPGPD